LCASALVANNKPRSINVIKAIKECGTLIRDIKKEAVLIGDIGGIA
jgi:hypothetical protein